MKVVIAPDSFKESMSAAEAASAMAAGVRRSVPHAHCVEIPMSDGGEGFARAVADAWNADWREIDVCDALGRPIRAGYGLDGDRAVMDMAATCGLELISPLDRDVWSATTHGVGLMIADARAAGARHIVIGIGGSATNDAGAGMVVALGGRLFDQAGNELRGAPRELSQVVTVDLTPLADLAGDLEITVACDVVNPLTGPRGATAVFGPQKGVSTPEIDVLDRALEHFAQVSNAQRVADRDGAGAAGGLGFALMAFLGATLLPGVDVVAQAVGLAEQVRDADLVLTGEGSVDAQTLEGKTPAGVAAVAAQFGVPAVVLAGRVRSDAAVLLEHGVTELVPIVDPATDLAQALADGPRNVESAAAAIAANYRI